MTIFSKKTEVLFLSFLILFTLFFGLFKLTESPATWYDEGFIIQSAVNLVDNGKLGIRISPQEVVGSTVWFSTSYPLVLPVGLALKIFGKSLLSARMVMLVFILLFVIASYFLAKGLWGKKIAVFASLLAATFAPLYGNGKNVLGELPGLFFLFLFFLFVLKIEKNKDSISNYILGGLALGLCVFTKSVFFLILPAVALIFFLKRKSLNLNKKGLILFSLGFVLTSAIWYFTQVYKTDTFLGAFSDLANPYAVQSVWAVVMENIKRFFSEAAPIHFLVLIIVWLASLAVRKFKLNSKISLVEIMISIFVLLIWAAYFRITGWYRYFFPAQMIMIFCLPAALFYIMDFLKNKRIFIAKDLLLYSALFGLAVFQIYQLCFNSWVAEYYYSRNTETLENYFSAIDKNQKIFIFNSPEVATFLPAENYYQYLKVSETISIGEKELAVIKEGIPDLIVVNTKSNELEKIGNLLSPYKEKERIRKYAIFIKS